MNTICMSRDGDTGNFRVHKNDSMILISDLNISSLSNFRTPHLLNGLGGANIALTDYELCFIVAEYLRYNVQETTNIRLEQVGFKFDFEINRDDYE